MWHRQIGIISMHNKRWRCIDIFECTVELQFLGDKVSGKNEGWSLPVFWFISVLVSKSRGLWVRHDWNLLSTFSFFFGPACCIGVFKICPGSGHQYLIRATSRGWFQNGGELGTSCSCFNMRTQAHKHGSFSWEMWLQTGSRTLPDPKE